MTAWYLRDKDRLKLEHRCVQKLLKAELWFISAKWGIASCLYVDIILRIHDFDFEFRVSFPEVYPFAPPAVVPKNVEERLSSHQYGPKGSLCLEWGPDNWHKDITIDEMILSAYKLIERENPFGHETVKPPVSVQSRHSLTFGQDLRSEIIRWVFADNLPSIFREHQDCVVGSFKFSVRSMAKCLVVLVHEVMFDESTIWKDPAIPDSLPNIKYDNLHNGVWIKTDLDSSAIIKKTKLTDLQDLLSDSTQKIYLDCSGKSPIKDFPELISSVILIDILGTPHYHLLMSKVDVYYCAPIPYESASSPNRRPYQDILESKMLGIVGLGSVGSKVCTSLARMGVSNFTLVDHDILLPGNLHRHDLDWEGVGQHKVDALKSAIERISPKATVNTSCLNLTGQESSVSLNAVISDLMKCDLLLDASGNDKVFNLISAIAGYSSTSMVWAAVFEGGLGGLIARSRPSVDPSPQDMRLGFLAFCEENPLPDGIRNLGNYTLENYEGEVIVASDADVSIIASNTSRFIADSLKDAKKSEYPNSMYLIGLSKFWVFRAPFDTIPLSFDSFQAQSRTSGYDQDSLEGLDFLLEILGNGSNDTSDTAES